MSPADRFMPPAGAFMPAVTRMRQHPIVKKFNMAQSALVAVSLEKQLYMLRDASDLAKRGVTAARIAAFKTQILDFTTLPTDVELDEAKQAATDRKEQAQTEAITQMQVVMGIVGTKHRPETTGYKRFGTSGLDSAGEGDLYTGLIRVVRVGRATLADYADKGLKAAMLDELERLNGEFLRLLGEQQDAEWDRGHAADTRILAANALYTELMDLCAVGKALYAQSSARQYEDYIVNDDPAPADAAPTPGPPVG
jgi:hypothetical protein